MRCDRPTFDETFDGSHSPSPAADAQASAERAELLQLRKAEAELLSSWYVYKDEDGNAVSVARDAIGPNGGWVGKSVAHKPPKMTSADWTAIATVIASAPALQASLSQALKDKAELLAGLKWYASPEAWTRPQIEGPNGDYGMRAAALIKKMEGK